MRAIREAKGRKVAELADKLGVHRSYIAHIENGSKRRISTTLYGAICTELLVEHRALMAVAPDWEPAEREELAESA